MELFLEITEFMLRPSITSNTLPYHSCMALWSYPIQSFHTLSHGRHIREEGYTAWYNVKSQAKILGCQYEDSLLSFLLINTTRSDSLVGCMMNGCQRYYRSYTQKWWCLSVSFLSTRLIIPMGANTCTRKSCHLQLFATGICLMPSHKQLLVLRYAICSN